MFCLSFIKEFLNLKKRSVNCVCFKVFLENKTARKNSISQKILTEKPKYTRKIIFVRFHGKNTKGNKKRSIMKIV